ncbi:glycoside hydrolase [Catenovulum maritimum]|uniref:Glycoside hydrolase n=2 Tax=Catenovulum maritimum TaxID=1513271 RepID=A0A0J8GWA4_9ALTE|nr:glycoside hydrolase [Catenovulum maritimum]
MMKQINEILTPKDKKQPKRAFSKYGRFSICVFSFLILSACTGVEEISTADSGAEQFEEQGRQALSLSSEQFYQAPAEVLKTNFKTPPEQVKPWVYWYWVSDHISKTGIEKDLAAMQKAGINTALIGIIHLKGKQGDVKALTDPWWDHVRFAIKKAADYNIDIGLFNSPGWSQSGGPWVDLDKSMRYLDSNEHQVVGPKQLNMVLNAPEAKGIKKHVAEFYQDVKVLAFKTPVYEKDKLTTANSKITISNPVTKSVLTDQDADVLFDGDSNTVYALPQEVLNHQRQGSRSKGQLQIDLVHPTSFQARSLEIYPYKTLQTTITLSAKNEAGEFEAVKTFEMQRPRNMAAIGPDHDAPIVVSFPAVDAKHFRLTFNGFNRWRMDKPTDPVGFKDIVLSKAYKLERYVEKKLAKVFPNPMPKFDTYQWPLPAKADDQQLLLKANDVLDITKHVKDGQLNWQVPAGDWTIVRYFMRPTGTENGPSAGLARGAEIDKQSKKIAQYHFDAYIGKFLSSMPAEDRTALKYAVIDSYEKGAQNWTDGFAKKFEQRYGYDPIPYMPVYSGRVVNSVEKSERFLWDVRRLVADNVAYEYTAGLRERANANGLKLWLENYGHWGFPAEFLQYGGQADIVSGEFWATGNLGAIELKAASSAAHIYGQKTVMSESFTSGRSNSFQSHPWNFKKRGDWSFVEGVNHTLLHVYIHQAYDDRFPGVNAWFGSEFNRNNTWFDYMGSWLDYIKRANYMMQQGKYVADIMYFIGEDAPKMTGEINPALPAGYSYDFINAEVILKRLSFADGYYQLPDGMRFKLLVLPNLETMRPAVLAKIAKLVQQGGAVYGPKPLRSPSLENFPSSDQQVQQLAQQLWQNIDGQQVTQARYGQGSIHYQQTQDGQIVDLAVLLNQLDTPADLGGLPAEVIWSHRSSDSHDIYFIANQSEQKLTINPSFRMTAQQNPQPQYFNAVTGEISAIAQFKNANGRIEIPMQLNDLESRFIVFEKQSTSQAQQQSAGQGRIHQVTHNGKAVLLANHVNNQGQSVFTVNDNGVYQAANHNGQLQTAKVDDLPAAITLDQPWQLTFEENRDVTTSLTLDKLTSLTELKPAALQHYSGSIKYQTTFTVDSAWLRDDQQLQLDLGEVGVIARVTVNGQDLGELWSRPLTVNINDVVKAGSNTLTVEVATTWLNRIIGDLKYPEQFPDSNKTKSFNTDITFEGTVKKTAALQRSGLIGPVQLKAVRKVRF